MSCENGFRLGVETLNTEYTVYEMCYIQHYCKNDKMLSATNTWYNNTNSSINYSWTKHNEICNHWMHMHKKNTNLS